MGTAKTFEVAAAFTAVAAMIFAGLGEKYHWRDYQDWWLVALFAFGTGAVAAGTIPDWATMTIGAVASILTAAGWWQRRLATTPRPRWAVAYCAPGTKAIAEMLLILKGEHAGEIIEHPYLAGCGYLILVSVELADRNPLDITWPL
jgi:hypothetical protein